jgi:hypothetical protein
VLKQSIVKWSKGSNEFALYDYDPVDTMGDLLPYHLKQLDDRLRRSRYYNVEGTFKGGCFAILVIFLIVVALIFALVFSIIYLAGVIGIWTIPAAFGLAFLYFGIGFFLVSMLSKLKDHRVDKMLESRTTEFNAILNQYMAEEPLFRELNHISISVGQFGSYLKLNYGNEYLDRVSGKKPHRLNTYVDEVFGAPEVSITKGGAQMDYPVANPF